jgi:hypothetical protein
MGEMQKEHDHANQTDLHRTAVGGGAAVAIAAAPAAAAANGQTCSGNICQSPGNVQINNARPPVQFYPYGDMPFLLGGLLG